MPELFSRLRVGAVTRVNPAAAGNVVQVVEVLPERETDKELES